jgi:hypothetical protein
LRHLFATVAVFALIATPALAALKNTTFTGSSAIDFSTLDTNQDGSLSSAELNAGGSFDENAFSDIDTDENGSLSDDEFNTWTTANINGSTSGPTNSGNRVGSVGVGTTGSNARALGGASANSNSIGLGTSGASNSIGTGGSGGSAGGSGFSGGAGQ